MKTNHTPAPWYAYNVHKNRILKNWRVASYDGDEVCILNDSTREYSNAKLIMAAPELLSILADVIKVIEDNPHLEGKQLAKVSEVAEAKDIIKRALGG